MYKFETVTKIFLIWFNFQKVLKRKMMKWGGISTEK